MIHFFPGTLLGFFRPDLPFFFWLSAFVLRPVVRVRLPSRVGDNWPEERPARHVLATSLGRLRLAGHPHQCGHPHLLFHAAAASETPNPGPSQEAGRTSGRGARQCAREVELLGAGLPPVHDRRGPNGPGFSLASSALFVCVGEVFNVLFLFFCGGRGGDGG